MFNYTKPDIAPLFKISFNVKKLILKILAVGCLAEEVVNYVETYEPNAAEGSSAFQHWSC